jgi:hypothetical protein
MKNGIKQIEGLKIVKAEGGRSGLTLVLSDGSTLEIHSEYEGGIIEHTAEQTVTEKKLVTTRID